MHLLIYTLLHIILSKQVFFLKNASLIQLVSWICKSKPLWKTPDGWNKLLREINNLACDTSILGSRCILNYTQKALLRNVTWSQFDTFQCCSYLVRNILIVRSLTKYSIFQVGKFRSHSDILLPFIEIHGADDRVLLTSIVVNSIFIISTSHNNLSRNLKWRDWWGRSSPFKLQPKQLK